MSLPVIQCMHNLQRAVLAAILHADYGNEADPHYAAQAEHDDDRICLAARNLVAAVNRLPDHKRPVGWDWGREPVALLATTTDTLGEYGGMPA